MLHWWTEGKKIKMSWCFQTFEWLVYIKIHYMSASRFPDLSYLNIIYPQIFNPDSFTSSKNANIKMTQKNMVTHLWFCLCVGALCLQTRQQTLRRHLPHDTVCKVGQREREREMREKLYINRLACNRVRNWKKKLEQLCKQISCLEMCNHFKHRKKQYWMNWEKERRIQGTKTT